MVFPPDVWPDPDKMRKLITAMLDGYNSQVLATDFTPTECVMAALNLAKMVIISTQENSGAPERFWLETATATFAEMMKTSTFQTADPEALSAMRAGAEELYRPAKKAKRRK